MSPDERSEHFRRQEAEQKAQQKAQQKGRGDRASYAQCRTCRVTCTSGPLTLPHYRDSDRRYRHTGCNGVFVRFDTNVHVVGDREGAATVKGTP